MNFSCDRCGRKYTVADEKVSGRSFKVKCKSCEHLIVVKASAPAAPAPVEAAAAAPVDVPGSVAPASVAPASDPFSLPSLESLIPAAGPPVPPEPDLSSIVVEPPPPPPAPVPQAKGPAEKPKKPARPAKAAREEAWLDAVESHPLHKVDPAVLAAEAAAKAAAEQAARERASAEAAEAAFHATPEAAPAEPKPTRAPRPPMTPEARRRLAVVSVLGGMTIAAATALGYLLLKPPAPAPHAEVAVASPPEAAPQAAPAPTAAPPAEAPKAVEPAPEPQPDARPAVAAAPEPAPPAAAPPSPAPAAPVARPARPRGAGVVADPREKQAVVIARRDKKLLDLLGRKGDSTPAAPVESATLDTGRAELDAAAVEKTLADNRGAFAGCITRALKVNPGLRIEDRKATLIVTLRPTGTVSTAWIGEADMDRSPLGACLKAVGRRLAFPAFQGESIDVTIPLALSAIR